jgi:dynein heavy chain
MDDNKVLTLVSQERIPMTDSMRLILEVSNLRSATPATVSRGGVLFINDNDIGWKPFFDSWLAKYKKNSDGYAENAFTLALTTYVNDSFLEDLHNKQHIAPVCVLGQIDTLTTIIDKLCEQLNSNKQEHDHLKRLKEENSDDSEKEIKQIYEAFFLFAGMWAFGASLDEDKLSFSNGWKSACASKIKFPEQGMCFDYYYDVLQGAWVHWETKVEPFDKNYDGLYNNLVVPTAETTRQKFLLDMHVGARKGVLYVGTAGTSKTTIIKDYFSKLDPETSLTQSISMNSYTDSATLQTVIMSQVDKRAGRTFGPPPSKTLIYFMDDLNMPKLDKYFTQSPICLVRQIIDYAMIYDRDKLSDKIYLVDIMFAACMNPKSGSFNIDIRLSRHFTLISCLTPEREILKTIYFQILSNHMENFDKPNVELCPKLINATMSVFLAIATSAQFAPTAIKFHYQFNLRDMARIVQNLLLCQPQHYKGNPLGVIRMWAHECHRVWHDRLIFDVDREAYMGFMRNGLKEFGDFKEEAIFEQPLIYTSFVAMCAGHEPTYLPVAEMAKLKEVLEGKLEEYNEVVAKMDLVLFDEAMEHIARITRIII